MKSRVAAYITCYQDQKSANQCIQAIESQSIKLKSIYIVDNSHEPLSFNNNGMLLIHHHPNNVGIAEGIANALVWAMNNEYDLLWTFDQNSMPTENCLEILLSIYTQLSRQDNYKIGIIAPTSSDMKTGKVIEGAIFLNDHFVGKKHNANVDFYECDSPITSGSLISLSAAKTIDPPHTDLFIDGVDSELWITIKTKRVSQSDCYKSNYAP